ncbi:hypothetical protein BGZ76_010884 [Entomortierella beljakovae]|nr:hypothetical protein BGZ76_010884 [Entomortierella beljakovae]
MGDLESYKEPLEGGDDIKVPVSDAVAERVRSNTYNTYGVGHNINNASTTTSGSNTFISPSTSTLAVTGDNEKRNSHGPRINAATKPSAGSFATATVTTSPSPGSELAPNTNNTFGSNVVPASATSSATPSRSSSTSNRGGAGVSTGSFTPLSVTPPLTPRLVHSGAVDTNTHGTPISLVQGPLTNSDGLNQPQPHINNHQNMMPPIATTSLSATQLTATTSSSAIPTSVGQYQQLQLQQLDQAPVIYTPPPTVNSDEEVVTSPLTLVSSPISYQPPSSPLSVLQTSQPQQQQQQQQQQSLYQDTFQFKYVQTISDTVPSNSAPLVSGDLVLTSSSLTTDSLLPHQQQQQQSQQQSQQLSQQYFATWNNSYNPLLNPVEPLSTAAPLNTMTAAAVATTTTTMTTTSTAPTPVESRLSNGPPVSMSSSENQRVQQSQPAPLNDYSHASGAGSSTNGTTHVHPVQPINGSLASNGSTFFPNPISRASTALVNSTLITHDLRQFSETSHITEGSGPVVLMAIGKTGQGKSSLLNKIMGTSELKASASVRAVTKGIAERSGWGRFEDSRRVLVTVADTPGLADTEGDDEKNIPILKEYIKSVGSRLGVTAFLLVFKIDSGVDMIITILATFNDIMKEFPDFWDNVVLVFTGCDYKRNVMHTKQFYHEKIQAQLEEHFFKDRPSSSQGSSNGSSSDPSSDHAVKMVFLSCAEAPCGFSLGEKCDCKPRTQFLNAGIKRLWFAIRDKKRWVLDQDSDDDGMHS